MKKWEFRVILATLIIGTAAAITVAVHDAARHTGAFTQTKAAKSTYTQGNEEIIIRATEAAKTAKFESEAENEQTANEEETETLGEVLTDTTDREIESTEVVLQDSPVLSDEQYDPATYDPATAENPWLPYRVGGKNLDREIGDFLLAELRSRDLEWWMPYGLAQIWAESSGNPLARNKNGKDMGILQYRVDYWDWSRGDIFDWRAQIRLYVEQTARRIGSGCSIWETISRHNTSDYGIYNQEYVDQVLRWVEPEC